MFLCTTLPFRYVNLCVSLDIFLDIFTYLYGPLLDGLIDPSRPGMFEPESALSSMGSIGMGLKL